MWNLETDRLILRNFMESDFEDLLEYLSDEEVVKYEPYHALTQQEARENLAWRCSTDEMIAVILKDNGKLIGNVYLGEREFDNKEIGYVFNRNYWKKGYAKEACKAVLAETFKKGTHRVFAECDPNNTASWGLLEGLGFDREAFLKQNVYFWKDEDGSPLWKDTFIYGYLDGKQATEKKMKPQLRIRPFRSKDAEIIAKWEISEDTFYKWNAGMWGEYPLTVERFLEVTAGRDENEHFFPFVAVAEDKVVGFFTLRNPQEEPDELRFGFVIVDPSVRGKGYGKEMLLLGQKYAFDVYQANKVSLGVFSHNQSAYYCYKAAGFEETGETEDYEIRNTVWKCIVMDRKKA